MQYYALVEKLRNHENLVSKDVTGFQLIMLLQDKEIKEIDYHGNTFEVNFIPITYAFEAYELKEEELPTFHDGEKIIEHWVLCYNVNKAIYVQIENEYFEVILDLLESAE
jgi:hypothetical protein